MDRMEAHRGAISRRRFCQGAALALGGLAAGARPLAADPEASPILRFGLLTDIHYADKETAGTRHYRDSLDKLREAVAVLNEEPLDFSAHLGDLIDRVEDVDTELEYLRKVEGVMEELSAPRHYVLGNHCVDTLTKDEFMAETGMEAAHKVFGVKGLRFVTLDACFREDGEPYGRHNFEWTDANIPKRQIAWLRDTLAANADPAIILAHQRLDDAGPYSVRNAPEVRDALEASGKVLAVFQGHSHEQTLRHIAGIAYCTQAAMIEGPGPDSSAYAVASVYPDQSIRVEGFRRQGNVGVRSAEMPDQ